MDEQLTDQKSVSSAADGATSATEGALDASAASVEEIVAALEGRAAFYDFLAALYFKPLTEEQIENIAQMDFSVYEGTNELFEEGLHDMSRFLRKRHTGTRQQLAVDFTMAFGGTAAWKGRYAVPYESVFRSEEGLMFQESYHEVYHLFREQRVERAAGYDYPDDHLSFMCEFLAILSSRAAEALRAGDYEGAREQLRTSAGFLRDHMLSWYDRLADLASNIIETRFYRGVMKMTKGFFLFDLETMHGLSDAINDLEFA
ncbi:MAG: molecular chaperone TorD family protein [Eggerthellaceae bacterium]|nr:molecular chaperone TorD family protein [Eggerthellaceae bacterium]